MPRAAIGHHPRFVGALVEPVVDAVTVFVGRSRRRRRRGFERFFLLLFVASEGERDPEEDLRMVRHSAPAPFLVGEDVADIQAQ